MSDNGLALAAARVADVHARLTEAAQNRERTWSAWQQADKDERPDV